MYNRTSEAQEPTRGALHVSGKNLGSNSDVPQEAEGETDQLPETISNCLLGKPCLSGSGSGVEVRCCVRVCENVRLRCNTAAKQVRSPDPQVHGELIGSKVSPTGPLVWGLNRLTKAKEIPKSLQRESPETEEASENPV
jgi:hypothetical protein